jgi:DNA repair protein RecN (Recombination protein N)
MPKAHLLELHAQRLGVIADTQIEFGNGFNVITGETGAGKTLLLGALELCLGGESSASRYALSTETRASALFASGTKETLLTREASQTGRLRSAINGQTASSEALKAIAQDLIVIHGQHDSLQLKSKSEVLRLIDESGNVETSDLESARRERVAVEKERSELGGDQASRERELGFLQYQISEISGASITDANELTETVTELTRLTELRDSQETLVAVLDALDGDHDRAVLSALASLIQQLPNDASLETQRRDLREALEIARNTSSELAALSDPDSLDFERMADLEARIGELQTLCRKYGGSLSSVFDALQSAQQEFERLSNAEERLSALDQAALVLDSTIDELSRKARRDREYAAVQLTEAVRMQLPRVALVNASLRFFVEGDDGGECTILFSPNPGQPEGPLQALASGGELSRVLLALSLVTADRDTVAVFDEVDAGVGGQVAQQIGDCLREVGQHQQVLAITHLASVAAKADRHFVITKRVTDGITTTGVAEVTGQDRVEEIARMLAGDEKTPESLALAERLLSSSF